MKKKYQVIYADPPWRYDRKKGKGVAENHYPTMGLQEICNLPVKEITDENCVLFLWTTFPHLREPFHVMKAWGFHYKTVGFVWIKKNKKQDSFFMGLGSWTRANAELCLIGTKGKPKRKNCGIHQLIISPIQRHSQKPAEARQRIELLLGDVPRIELFARECPEGWDVWGNEVTSNIEWKDGDKNGLCTSSEGLNKGEDKGLI